jgi:hypothetical protein
MVRTTTTQIIQTTAVQFWVPARVFAHTHFELTKLLGEYMSKMGRSVNACALNEASSVTL